MTQEPPSRIGRALGALEAERTSESAWRVIAEFTLGVVRALARSHARLQPDDEDDLASEVIVRIVRYARFAEFDRDERRFRAYLLHVTRSVIAHSVRRRARERKLSVQLELDAPSLSHDVVTDPETLNELIGRLLNSDTFAPAELDLLQRVACGTPREKIAADLRLTPGALGVRLFRVRYKVCKWLSDNSL